MGCVCCSLSSFISVVLDALERISLCTVCAMLTCCLLFTILTVLVLGIGIGYHYCFVQTSVQSMSKAGKVSSAEGLTDPVRRQGNLLRSVNKAVQRGFAHRHSRRDADAPLGSNNLTVGDNYTQTDGVHVLSDTPLLHLLSTNTTNYTVFS
ncbi:uncharacterized protein LOC118269307 [Spodoptera frugiperda]|uniref:Uncharacterized protein LOC118269307 n=1 Tax=Spodoptera frugiperda TaxID=7108 RepID=A0A9R0D4W2_SPOFR|nr:uncharacterized protein LOC118269307 [Spodoptera frugiperda]